MRVSFVMATASRTSYGMFPAVVGTTRALWRSGHQPTVVATRDEYTEEDRPLWGEVPVEAFRSFGPRKLFLAPVAPLWFGRQTGIDVVSIQGVWACLFDGAVRYAQRTGAPLVLTPHGMLEPWALKHSRWKKRLAEWIYVDRMLSSVNCFHVNSEAEGATLRELGYKAPIAVIPHGVDLPTAPPMPSTRSQQTLLFLSRLHKKKGIRELVQAWKNVSERAPNWRLVIAGPDEQGLLQGLKSTSSGSRIEFVGPVFGAEKEALFEHADALILPSYSEGFPVSVLEAWSYGLPVFKTRACNIPEGFLAGAAVEVASTVRSLEDSLNLLFSMPHEQLREMGKRGRALVESRYTWNRVAQDLGVVYEWLRGERPRPPSVHLS